LKEPSRPAAPGTESQSRSRPPARRSSIRKPDASAQKLSVDDGFACGQPFQDAAALLVDPEGEPDEPEPAGLDDPVEPDDDPESEDEEDEDDDAAEDSDFP